MGASKLLFSRQVIENDPNLNNSESWWYYSTTALIIKWVVAAAIVIALILFVVGGRIHAQRRIKKGLPPLRYHAWLLNRQQRARFFPQQTYYHTGGWNRPWAHGPAVPMQPQAPPPPAYGEHDYVPPYAPPEGGSKANPNQAYEVRATEAGSSSYAMPAAPGRAASFTR